MKNKARILSILFAVCLLVLAGCAPQQEQPTATAAPAIQAEDLVVATAQPLATADPEENMAQSQAQIGYVMGYFRVAEDGSNGEVDWVEWLTMADEDRLTALGVDVSNGLDDDYYIYNETAQWEKFPFAAECRMEIIRYEEGIAPVEVSLEELKSTCAEYGSLLAYVTIQNGEIAEISQIYVP